MRSRLTPLAVALLLSGCGAAGGPGAPPAPPEAPQPRTVSHERDFVPGHILIKGTRARLDGQTAVPIRGRQTLGSSQVELLEVDPSTDILAACKKLRALGGVEFAEPDYLLHTCQTPPNDPNFGQQWPLRNTGQNGGLAGADIRALEAWSTTQGDPNLTVAVIDTGVDYNHPDLKDNVWNNPQEQPNGVDDDGNGYVDDLHGISTIPGKSDPLDDNSHGTHCAGIVAAVTNNGAGVAGVAPKVKIMALKFLDANGSGPTSRALGCIDYAIAKKARVISASWGGEDGSEALEDAIRRAGAAGVVFVCAAGNFAQDNDLLPNYPSNYTLDNLISVGASTRTDGLMALSNFGRRSVHLFAPGFEVLSTIPGGGYGTKSGTSMATPHVAGAVALLLSANPGLTPAAARGRLLAGTRSLPAFQGICQTGGRLDARGALDVTSSTVYLSSLLPATARAGDTLTLYGQGFGNTPGSVRFQGGTASASTWSDTAVNVVVPTGATTGPVRVRTQAGTESNEQSFSLYTGVVYRQETVPSTYQSIATTGTALTMVDDDSRQVDIGFPFPYHGQPRTSLWISSNGFVTFAEGGASSPDNRPIPSGVLPNDMIASLWDDLNPELGGTIRYQQRPGEFVVEWNNLQHYPKTAQGATIQLVLKESGEILCHYPNLTFGDTSFDDAKSATIGVENQAGDYGTAFSGKPPSSLRYTAQAGSTPDERSVSLPQGWSLASLDASSLTSVTPGPGVAGGVSWNAAQRVYETVQADVAGLTRPLQQGLGLWLYATQPSTLAYRGPTTGGHFSVDLSTGWNLISVPGTGSIPASEIASTADGVTMSLPAATASRILSTWYYGTSGAYGTVDATGPIPAGRAYWVYSQGPGRLSR